MRHVPVAAAAVVAAIASLSFVLPTFACKMPFTHGIAVWEEPSLIVYAKSAKIPPYTSFGIDLLADGSTMLVATIAKVDAISNDNKLELLKINLSSHWSDKSLCIASVQCCVR